MKILCGYDYHQDNPNPGYDGYINALRMLGHEVPDAWDMRRHLEIPRDGHDLFIQFDCCDTFAPPRLNYPSVYWAYDNWQNYENKRQPGFVGDGHFCRAHEYYLPRAKMADLTFSMSVLGVQNYAAHGIESMYLPIGGDERLECPPESVEKTMDVVGICNGWGMDQIPKTRGVMIGAIEGTFPNLKTQLSNQINYYDQADIYASAKIGFNYSPGQGFDVLNYRTFEIMIAGTCQLINAEAIPSLKGLGYFENEHFVAYRSEDELLQKIRQLLDDEKERERIAAAGYLHTKTNHTMRHRMKVMVELAKRRLNKNG